LNSYKTFIFSSYSILSQHYFQIFLNLRGIQNTHSINSGNSKFVSAFFLLNKDFFPKFKLIEYLLHILGLIMQVFLVLKVLLKSLRFLTHTKFYTFAFITLCKHFISLTKHTSKTIFQTDLLNDFTNRFEKSFWKIVLEYIFCLGKNCM